MSTTTRRAAIFAPSIPGQWIEDTFGMADWEADTAAYTIIMLTPYEMTSARDALPAGYIVSWAAPGRYVDDTEGAVIVAADGSLGYSDEPVDDDTVARWTEGGNR